MDEIKKQRERTRELLLKQYYTYPQLQPEDMIKYIFQSSFGCEHLVASEDAARAYIRREYEALSQTGMPKVEKLDGDYSRVSLTCLNEGLDVATLTKLFCLSAQKEADGRARAEQKLEVANALVNAGELPFEARAFEAALADWRKSGYPAIHHSHIFRTAYSPAYRVIANRYTDFLSVFTAIDRLLSEGNAIVAIEGGSASGKTTLANVLQTVYDCNVFHMDDFFLRPEQRTPQRLAEIGGNVDRERFFEEILQPLKKNEAVRCRRFDCSTQALGEPITVPMKKLTVIEGVYSMHPMFEEYYDLAVFLEIDPAYQRKRILKRNTPTLAKRFFEEWIPLENLYFSQMQIKSRCSVRVAIEEPCAENEGTPR